MIKKKFQDSEKTICISSDILKAPVKFEKDWPKTVRGVAGRRMVGALMDGHTDRQTDGHSKFQRV